MREDYFVFGQKDEIRSMLWFSLLLWDAGSVVKERLAFAIDDIAIMFQAKVLPKYWKVPQGPEFANEASQDFQTQVQLV